MKNLIKQGGLWPAIGVKNQCNNSPFTQDPSLSLLQGLSVRALKTREYERAGQLFDDGHYLGDLSRGRCLLQVVENCGQWLALLDWGPAAWKLADRESRIGWSPQQRAERLFLVVQNRRKPWND